MNKIFKNPYINSIYAEAYIVIVAFIMRHVGKPDTPDNFFTPIAALSLLVLSAAVMAYLFLGQPLQLYLDGQKKQSVAFFMKTVITFAAITAVALIILSRTMG
jgi:hypothetical protein